VIRRQSTERTPTPQAGWRLRGLANTILWFPTAGYGAIRRSWARLRCREELRATPKTVHRALTLKGWFVHQRPVTPRPRTAGWISRTDQSNVRWATDVTHVFRGRDGSARLAVVLDCHDPEAGELPADARGRALLDRTLRLQACPAGLGTFRPTRPTPAVLTDNGLIYRPRQKFPTPCTSQQNGIVERLFRSLEMLPNTLFLASTSSPRPAARSGSRSVKTTPRPWREHRLCHGRPRRQEECQRPRKPERAREQRPGTASRPTTQTDRASGARHDLAQTSESVGL
jgi:putative transposase